jgi:hypothetical protein
MNNGRLSRREILRALQLSAAGSTTLPLWLSSCREQLNTPQRLEEFAVRRANLGGKPKFLIVVSATGGASIVDSFLAVRASECSKSDTLNTFPDADVQSIENSPFRAVKFSSPTLGDIPQQVNADQKAFVQKHKADMLVATTIGTSVNHIIAQKRSLTGNNAWRGRTLQECMALQYGADMPLPNVNMASVGYVERGSDASLPAYCYGETVQNPLLWPLSLDGSKGLKGAPQAAVLTRGRNLRRQLELNSRFNKTFVDSQALANWNQNREVALPKLEAADLISKLTFQKDAPPAFPLSDYGLSASSDAERVRAAFPSASTDVFEAQAALAFLLLKNRVSTAVTLGPSFNTTAAPPPNLLTSPPLAFDFSHGAHRATQAFMWQRILKAVDSLIALLKAEPFETGGESMWDRSLIYVATDFGRTRDRTASNVDFGSGHDLNNGVVLLSPMVKGNTVLGGVDPQTTLTYGFDARTGAPEIGKTSSNEADIFSGILTTLGVDLSGSGLPDASAFRRS